jgi:hypothetical protein
MSRRIISVIAFLLNVGGKEEKPESNYPGALVGRCARFWIPSNEKAPR